MTHLSKLALVWALVPALTVTQELPYSYGEIEAAISIGVEGDIDRIQGRCSAALGGTVGNLFRAAVAEDSSGEFWITGQPPLARVAEYANTLTRRYEPPPEANDDQIGPMIADDVFTVWADPKAGDMGAALQLADTGIEHMVIRPRGDKQGRHTVQPLVVELASERVVGNLFGATAELQGVVATFASADVRAIAEDTDVEVIVITSRGEFSGEFKCNLDDTRILRGYDPLNRGESIMRRSARRANPASPEPAAPAARPTADVALDAVDAPAAPSTADVVAMRELMQTGAMRQDLMLTQAMAYIPARDGNSFTVFNFEIGKDGLTLDSAPASMLAFGVLLQRDPAAANGEHFMRDIKSTFAVSPDESNDGGSATHSFGMTLPPGDYRLAWGVMDKGSENIATTSYEFRVPDYASEGLEIPSVLVAAGFEQQPDAIDVNTVYRGTRVGNLTLNTNLDNDFGRDDSLRLLYFVKGLAVDEATLQPAFEVGHRIFVAGTEDSIDRRPPVPFNVGAVDWELPLAEVAQLEAGGAYEIEIHLTDQVSGAELIKRVPFTVRANQAP